MVTRYALLLLLVLNGCMCAAQDDEYSFGTHRHEPMVPPGIPPDTFIDLTWDSIPEAVITGYMQYHDSTHTAGYFTRGVKPAPGVAMLMERKPDGTWGFYHLMFGTALIPTELAMRLQSGSLRWALPEQEPLFYPVVQHHILQNEYQGWFYAWDEYIDGNPVYRTMSEGQVVIGVMEISAGVPSGRLDVNQQRYVNEGEVLEVR